MIENFEQLSVRNDLTNRLNSMKKREQWYEKLRKMFVEPFMPKQRINPSVLPSNKNSQFKELSQDDFEEER
jgi:hypothetical protein